MEKTTNPSEVTQMKRKPTTFPFQKTVELPPLSGMSLGDAMSRDVERKAST